MVFVMAGVILVLAGYTQWQARNALCPIDLVKANACQSARRTSSIVYFISIMIFLAGVGFAFVPELLEKHVS